MTRVLLSGTVLLLFLLGLAEIGRAESLPVVWGYYAGLGLARVTHNFADKQSSRARASVGVSVEVAPRRASHLSFRTGLGYIGKGGRSGFSLYGTDEQGHEGLLAVIPYVWSLHYLRVPIQAQLSGEVGGIRCFLTGGPELGGLLGAHVSFPDWMRDGHPIVDQSLNNTLREFEFSVGVGGGVLLPIDKSKTLRLASSYVHGITNAYDSDFFKMKTRTIDFSVGVEFHQ